jgi:hypothetical protein
MEAAHNYLDKIYDDVVYCHEETLKLFVDLPHRLDDLFGQTGHTRDAP